jgi:hypothetical protein
MTSATARQARGTGRGEGYWMVIFAASLLGVGGTFNLIDGIAAVARSHVFIANAHYVIGDLRTWAGSGSPPSGSAPSPRCSSSPPTRSGP